MNHEPIEEAENNTPKIEARRIIEFACNPGVPGCEPIFEDSERIKRLHRIIEHDLKMLGRLPN